MQHKQDNPILLDGPTEAREKQQAKEQRRAANRRRLQFVFNVILTISTIVTAGIVLYQNRILDRTLDEMRLQSEAAQNAVLASKEATAVNEKLAREAREQSDILTERSLNEAREARAVSMLAVRTAQESNFNSGRAYVLVDSARLEGGIVQNEPLRIAVELKNSGATPALDVMTTHVVAYGGSGAIAGNRPQGDESIPKNLGAGQTMTLRMTEPFDQQFRDRMLRKEHRLMIPVTIFYRDVFSKGAGVFIPHSNAKGHVTEACIIYDIDANAFDSCGTTVREGYAFDFGGWGKLPKPDPPASR